MVKRRFKVIDEAGLHARPASLLVQKASTFDEDIRIFYKDKDFTLKSIMVLMSLGIGQDAEFEIGVPGDNAEALLDALENVLKTHEIIN